MYVRTNERINMEWKNGKRKKAKRTTLMFPTFEFTEKARVETSGTLLTCVENTRLGFT